MSEGSSVGKVSGPPRHWDYLLTTMMTQIGVKFSCHSVLLTNDRRDIFPPPCCLHRTNSKILKTSMDTEHGEWKIDPRCFHLSIETLDKTSGERKALYEWSHDHQTPNTSTGTTKEKHTIHQDRHINHRRWAYKPPRWGHEPPKHEHDNQRKRAHEPPKTKYKKGGRQKEDHSPKTRKIKDLKKAVSFAFNANVPFLI